MGDIQEFLKERLKKIKKPMDTYKMEGLCPICGRYDVIYPGAEITVCDRCMSRLTVDQHVQVTKFISVGYTKCDLCGRNSVIMYTVRNFRACIKCLWYRLGKKKTPLRIFGDYAL